MMSDEETAVPYAAFKEAGFKVQFATETGKTPQCDKRMMEGVTGKLLGAKAAVVEGCKSMLESDEARHPLSRTAPGFSLDTYNLVVFPGGHDKVVGQIIDSKEVHKLILDYFPKTKKPSNKAVGVICHGVMVLSSAKGSSAPRLHCLASLRVLYTELLGPLLVITIRHMALVARTRKIL
ncbi:hypothetical protein FVER14953_21266 [Fusarium verticillioides]|nr:hypothetical protein FVER14953_21266 [Fusarium verticillioides]